MIKEIELKEHKEYWLENIQNDLYFKIKEYMESEDLNQKQLAEKFGFSKGYISQILNGNFNYSIGKYIELALNTGHYPDIKFIKKELLKSKKTGKVITLNISNKKNKTNRLNIANIAM